MKKKTLIVLVLLGIFPLALTITPTEAQGMWTDTFTDTSKIASSTNVIQVTDTLGFGKSFTRYSGNPLLTLESCDPWDAGNDVTKQIPGTVHPSVLYFPGGIDGYKFWMVFTPAPETGSVPQGGSGSPDYWWERCTLVRSNDGINWVKTPDYTNPLISPGNPGEWDSGWHCDPDLVYAPGKGPNGESWFLYYCGCSPMSVGVALSQDGKHYTKYAGSPVIPPGGSNTRCPSIIYDETTEVFHAWYNWGSFEIGYANSTDGLNWIPYSGDWSASVVFRGTPGNFDQGGVTHQDVIYYQGQYWMYYLALPTSDYSGLVIGLATSPDGIHWTKCPNPVLTPGETWNFYNPAWLGGGGAKLVQSLYHPSPVVVGDTMYMYYGGTDDYVAYPAHNYETGLAFSTLGPKGHVELEKYSQSSEYPARLNTDAWYHMNEGAPPPPAYPGEYASKDSTLAWYHLNEGTGTVAGDSSGNNNVGALDNPPGQPTWTAGLYDDGMAFDGNDRVTVPNSATLNPTDAVTIEAWVKTSVDKQNNYVAIKMTPGTGDYSYGLKLENYYASHSEVGAFVQDGSGNMYFAYGGSVPTGTWTHVAMTYEKVSTGMTHIRLYENGVEVTYRYGAKNAATDTIPADTSIRSNTGPLTIGCIPIGTPLYYNGIMDEVRIVGRALSADEIAADGKILLTTPTVLDSSGNNNHGSPAGAVTWTTGRFSFGLSFDGSTGYVNVLNSETLDLTEAMTLEAWVNPSVNKQNNYVVSKETQGGTWPNTDYSYGLKLESGYTGYSEIGACIADPSGNYYFAYGGSVPTGTWTHVAMTYEKVSTGMTHIRLYENGVEVTYRYGAKNAATDTIPADTSIRSNTGPLTIGCLPESTPLYYNGVMDEIRVLGRALTSNEILADYGVCYKSSGNVTSVLITPGSRWDHFYTVDQRPTGTSIAYSILSGAGDTLIPSVNNGTDISSLGNTPLRLHAELTTSDPSITPILCEWSTTFSAQYYLTVTSPYDTPTPTSGWFNVDTSITASVTSPSPGPTGTRYVCTGWTGTGSVPASGTTSTVTFTINQPSNVTWNWKTQYLLTVLTDPTGSSPQPTRNPTGEAGPVNGWWYDNSANVLLTAQSVAGYTFSNWDVDGTSQGSGVNPITINTNARHAATAHYQAIPPSASVQTATGTGTATVATDVGYIQDLTAVAEATLPSWGKPGLLFTHGFFSFKVAGLSSGQTAKITITLPLNVPLGSQYWKCQTGVWRQVPIGDDDGDNVITIQLRDGGTYDGDGLPNGQITDPGGLGIRLPAPPDGIVAKYDLDDGVKENDPTWGTVFTTAMYGAVAKSDDIYAVTRVVHTYDYSQQFFRFDVGTAITEFTVTWKGNIAFKEAFLGNPGPHTEGIDIWNKALNTWEHVGNVTQVGDFYTVPGAPVGASVQGKLAFMAPDDTVSKTYNTNLNNYVTSGHVYLMVWAKNSHDATISTDYVGFQCKNAPHPPVGGEWVPTSKFRLLAPMISLVLMMTLVTVSFVYVKRKRHQD